MSVSGSKGYKSGILSLPTRVMIRDSDSASGSYPTIARTTGKSGDLLGNKKLAYDDTRTEIFHASENMVFPFVKTAHFISQSNTSALIATPNKVGTIITRGTSSDANPIQGFVSSIPNGLVHLPFDETRISRTDLRPSDRFYLTGTKPEVLRGFTSPLRDKISITVPINNSVEKIAARYSTAGLLLDSDGQFPQAGDQHTGFLYYNPELNTWEDIGLVDHLYGDSTRYKMYYQTRVSNVGPTDCWIAGDYVTGSSHSLSPKYPKMQQFKMSDHTAVYIDSVADITSGDAESKYSLLTSSLNYQMIGSPTIAGMAPNSPIYHATSSQTISVDNYIVNPFLLEAATLEIPVAVQRMRGEVARPTEESRFYESCRDVDNYTFFLYRQTDSTRAPVDSEEHVSTSRRYLIASGCATFSNTNALSGRVPDQVRSKGWPHTPAFSYDFLIPSGAAANTSPTAGPVYSHTGTLLIKIKPAIANGQCLGGSRFPLGPSAGGFGIGNSGASVLPVDGVRSIVTQDIWPGGSTTLSGNIKPASSRQNKGTINSNVFRGSRDPQVSFAGSLLHSEYNNLLGEYREFILKDSIGLIDPRFIASTHTLASTGSTSSKYRSGLTKVGQETGVAGYTNLTNVNGVSFPIGLGSIDNSIESPYLLLPGDKLVLGLDVGVSMLPSSGANMTYSHGLGTVDVGRDLGFYSASGHDKEFFGTISGSYMRLLKGQSKLTLYGSLVRDGVEIFHESNQNITSDAIHEAIGNTRLVDQYDTPTRNDLSGSYVDRFIAGAMGSGKKPGYQTDNGVIYGGHNTIFENFGFNLQRSVRGIFSKSRIGISDSTQDTFFSKYRVGAPPLLAFSANATRIANGGVIKDDYRISRFSYSIFDVGQGFRSLQRFVGLDCKQERFYDTVMPDVRTLVERSDSLEKEIVPSGTFAYRIVMDKHRKVSYPYVGNPARFLSQKYYLRLAGQAPTTNTATNSDFKSDYSNKLVNTCLFQRGWAIQTYSDSTGDISNIKHPVSGGVGPLYGIMSPMPKYSRAIFRRDRYGQFRDMLEQRKYGVFFLNGKTVSDAPINIKFVDQADGVSPVSPFSTDSVNCSTVSSCSVPYADDRSLNPPGDGNVVISVGNRAVYIKEQ